MKKSSELSMQRQGELVHAIDQQGIGEVLKPLRRKIHLFDTYIAGTSRIEDQNVFNSIKAGDSLVLRREQNRYDDKAILVQTSDQKKLGYVPERDNLVFARLMDAGKMLTAHVQNVMKRGDYTQVDISIYLVDF